MDDKDLPTVEEFNALFAQACENHQNRLYQQAMEGYQELISYFPGAPILHYNLGLLFFETEHYQEAVGAFSTSAELQPDDPDIAFNLALSHRKLKEFDLAIKEYQRVLELEPSSVDARYNLGGCYREIRDYKSAESMYRQVLVLEETNLSATNNLAYVYQRQGERGKAIEMYQRVLELDSTHSGAKHMLAALLGEQVSSSPSEYVRDVFDNYSERYEKSLVEELEYNVPEKIKEMLCNLQISKKSFSYGLDLGCGTGLSGESFSSLVNRLAGVDLSPKMVEIAKAKDVYSELHVAGIEEYLQKDVGPFDFVLAADVFGYVGDLERTFTLIHKTTASEVLFCFSTELIQGKGFKLRQTGRFGHSISYIEDLAERTGWVVSTRRDSNLRKEQDQWIAGSLWFMEKASL